MRRHKIILASVLVIASLIVGFIFLWGEVHWKVGLTEEWTTGGVRYRRLYAATAHRRADLDVVLIARRDLRAAVLAIDPKTPSPLQSHVTEATVAINGGYFNQNRQPLGLLRIDGRELSPLKDQAPLSGILTLDERGAIAIAPTSDSATGRAHTAIQAGPFLIDPGGAMGIRSDTGERTERTVIAISAETVCVIRTTPLSLHELATLLHGHAPAFGVEHFDRALNLDGGPSSGIALRAGSYEVIREPRGPIINAVVISAR